MLGHGEPPFDEGLVDFQVKLKPIDVGSITERLVTTCLRSGERDDPRRKVKSIIMPLKDLFRPAKVLE